MMLHYIDIVSYDVDAVCKVYELAPVLALPTKLSYSGYGFKQINSNLDLNAYFE